MRWEDAPSFREPNDANDDDRRIRQMMSDWMQDLS